MAATAASAWFGYEAIVNPDLSFWLRQYLPGPTAAEVGETAMPQTLSQISRSLEQSGQTPQEPLVLGTAFAFRSQLAAATDVLLPIAGPSPTCGSDCQGITELRLYRSLQIPYLLRIFQGQPYFRLLDRMVVVGPEEGDVIASPLNPQLANYGSTRRLPLTQLELETAAPSSGVWLRLTGLLSTDSSTAYGQILQVDLERARLNLILNWRSTSGEPPTWRQVTGTTTPELVINQSVALEPDFQVYQVQTGADGEPRLRAIALAEPSLTDPTYADALALARSGLWSPALDWLQQVRQQASQPWTPAAQAQFDLIQMHAQVTRAQANQPAASVGSRVLAYLINGSWTPALQVLQANSAARSEIRDLLLTDSGRLFKRIETSVTLDPTQSDDLTWGAMILTTQQGRPEAIAWLRQYLAPGPTFRQVEKNLQALDPTPVPGAKPAALPQQR